MGVMDMMSGKASRKKAEQYAPQIAVNLTGAVILQDFIDKEGDNLSRFQWRQPHAVPEATPEGGSV